MYPITRGMPADLEAGWPYSCNYSSGEDTTSRAGRTEYSSSSDEERASFKSGSLSWRHGGVSDVSDGPYRDYSFSRKRPRSNRPPRHRSEERFKPSEHHNPFRSRDRLRPPSQTSNFSGQRFKYYRESSRMPHSAGLNNSPLTTPDIPSDHEQSAAYKAYPKDNGRDRTYHKRVSGPWASVLLDCLS
jgi:hypothetical protein